MADENGLARDGEFTSSSTYVETWVSGDWYSSDFHGLGSYDDTETYDITGGTRSQATKVTSETGSYYDLPLLFGTALRIQSGEYTIEETTRETQQVTSFHDDVQGNVALGTVVEQVDTTRDLLEETSRVTTTGSYGPGGITQQIDYATALVDREYEQYIFKYLSTGATTTTTERYSLDVHNDNGEFSGHKYHRKWEVDEYGTTELIDPIVDEDLFDGQTPPAGPPPIGPYEPKAPGEGGQSGQGEETPNVFSPGTLDVTIEPIHAAELDQALKDALFPGQIYDESFLSEIDRLSPAEPEPPKVVDIKQIGSDQGLGSIIFGDDGSFWKNRPQDSHEVLILRELLNTAFPPSTPSYELTYDDGTKRIILNGEPTTEDLAGQALLLAPFLAKGTGTSGATVHGGKPVVETPRTPSGPRPGSVSGNPANRLIEVPTKNGKVVNRYVRITAEDAQRYREALRDRSVELLDETPSHLSGEAARKWRHQRMNEFRREWLDEFYKTRDY